MDVRSSVLDQDDRIDIVADAVFRLFLFAVFGLQRSETKLFVRIVPDNKIDGAVAKVAHTVEKYDRSHNKIVSQLSDRFEFRLPINFETWNGKCFGRQ